MARKGGVKKRSRSEGTDRVVEDLDLDVTTSINDVDDEDVVHNRRSRKVVRRGGAATPTGEDDAPLGVLPSDAHRLDGYGDDEHGGYLEEEELAVATERDMRRKTTEADFDISGVAVSKLKSVQNVSDAATKAADVMDFVDSDPVMEAVERDFASLTTGERLAVLKKESPELLKMLEDLKTYMAEVKTLAKPLHELLYKRKVETSDRNLVSFLETKVQLMLSYCMHVTFYLLLKSEGKKVEGHPVIDNLVEIRIYLEKMWPLEEKLQYSLNRLLSGKSTAAAQLDQLRPIRESDSGVYEAGRSGQNTEARERRQQERQAQEAEELEKEELSAMTRVRTKKASALNATSLNSTITPVSYQESEDQYFSRMIDGDDDDGEEGLSLMESLRRRQQKAGAAAQKQITSEEDLEDEPDDDDDFFGDVSDGSMEMDGAEEGGDEEDEVDYDAVFAEDRARQDRELKDQKAATVARGKLVPEEVDRRKAGKKIESHRGLTKARPKDRKNPRVAQRRKYERGLQVHKSQSKSFQAEPDGGFIGVRSLRPGVVRGTKLQ